MPCCFRKARPILAEGPPFRTSSVDPWPRVLPGKKRMRWALARKIASSSQKIGVRRARHEGAGSDAGQTGGVTPPRQSAPHESRKTALHSAPARPSTLRQTPTPGQQRSATDLRPAHTSGRSAYRPLSSASPKKGCNWPTPAIPPRASPRYATLSDRKHVEGIRRRLSRARKDVAARLGRIGIEPWPMPRGGFYLWCALLDGRDAAEIARAAMQNNIVLPGNIFSPSQSAASLMRFNVSQMPERAWDVLDLTVKTAPPKPL